MLVQAHFVFNDIANSQITSQINEFYNQKIKNPLHDAFDGDKFNKAVSDVMDKKWAQCVQMLKTNMHKIEFELPDGTIRKAKVLKGAAASDALSSQTSVLIPHLNQISEYFDDPAVIKEITKMLNEQEKLQRDNVAKLHKKGLLTPHQHKAMNSDFGDYYGSEQGMTPVAHGYYNGVYDNYYGSNMYQLQESQGLEIMLLSFT
eukprot:751801_1